MVPIAGKIKVPQLLQRCCISLIGGKTVKTNCFINVFWNAIAIVIAESQIMLRRRIALIGGKSVIFYGQREILIHAVTVMIANSQIILRFRKTLIGCSAIIRYCRRLILWFLSSMDSLMNAAYSNKKNIRSMVADIVTTYHPADSFVKSMSKATADSEKGLPSREEKKVDGEICLV